MYRSALILCLFLHASLAWGAEVLRVGSSQRIIAISHDDSRQWSLRDYVCVLQAGREIGCGTVVKVTPKGAIVKLNVPNADIARGDVVRSSGTSVSSTPGARKPALALLNSVEKDANAEVFHWNVAGGLTAGLTFFFPLVRLERLLSPSASLAILPMYFRASANDATVSAFGIFMTGNYYGNEYFRGLWIQGGVGAYFYQTDAAGVQDSANGLAGLATIGWRGYWDFGLNIGVGVGLQYAADPNILSVEIKSTGIQPMVTLDVGVNF